MLLTRKRIAMLMAEFLGVGVLTLIVLAVAQSNVGIPYFISIAAGLALITLVLVLGRVSGAHLNPAITIGLWSLRRIKALPALGYIGAQVLGGIAAYYLYTYFIGSTWENLGAFEAPVLVAEAVGAFIFAMGWAAVIYQKYEGLKAAFVIGISFTTGLLVASIASVAAGVMSGGFINPAIALGAQSLVWGSYALGPVLGAIIGFNLYALLFAPASELAADEKKAMTATNTKTSSKTNADNSSAKSTKKATVSKTSKSTKTTSKKK